MNNNKFERSTVTIISIIQNVKNKKNNKSTELQLLNNNNETDKSGLVMAHKSIYNKNIKITLQ